MRARQRTFLRRSGAKLPAAGALLRYDQAMAPAKGGWFRSAAAASALAMVGCVHAHRGARAAPPSEDAAAAAPTSATWRLVRALRRPGWMPLEWPQGPALLCELAWPREVRDAKTGELASVPQPPECTRSLFRGHPALISLAREEEGAEPHPFFYRPLYRFSASFFAADDGRRLGSVVLGSHLEVWLRETFAIARNRGGDLEIVPYDGARRVPLRETERFKDVVRIDDTHFVVVTSNGRDDELWLVAGDAPKRTSLATFDAGTARVDVGRGELWGTRNGALFVHDLSGALRWSSKPNGRIISLAALPESGDFVAVVQDDAGGTTLARIGAVGLRRAALPQMFPLKDIVSVTARDVVVAASGCQTNTQEKGRLFVVDPAMERVTEIGIPGGRPQRVARWGDTLALIVSGHEVCNELGLDPTWASSEERLVSVRLSPPR